MKVDHSLSFYHIPEFLKNDSDKDQKSAFSLHLKEMLISKLYAGQLSVPNYYGNGGAKRDRTADLLRARQALSQLSYGPVSLQGAPVIGGSGQIRTADLTLIRGAL